HLVIDGVSWRILLGDLQNALLQLGRGESITLPSKTSSYKSWAEALIERARSMVIADELAYWMLPLSYKRSWLPVDNPEGVNIVESEGLVSISLSADETRALLKRSSHRTSARIEEILLTALGQTIAAWTNDESFLIAFEGHGREDVANDLSLHRTIGWFTAIYPVLLKIDRSVSGVRSLKSIAEQLRRIPDRGISYGLLRYLTDDANVREKLQSLSRPEIVFNFLGQTDQLFSESSIFELASDRIGHLRSPQARRIHLLEINGIITGGQLHVDWTYSENVHRKETIERVVSDFTSRLRNLISDTEQSEIDLRDGLDHLNDQSLCGADGAEDLYPISPMQKSLLLHALYAQKRGVYIEQLVCTLKGELNAKAFVQSWQHVIDDHNVLRTSFRWKNVEEPLQVVHKRVTLPFVEMDWQSRTQTEQKQQLEAFLQADREQGFDLSTAPLLRLSVIRTTLDSYIFVFSFHHVVMDGWSLSLVLQQVFAHYEVQFSDAHQRALHHGQFKQHILRLKEQDLSEAEHYWRKQLKGFVSPTILFNDKSFSEVSD